jgi:hypothetical protein
MIGILNSTATCSGGGGSSSGRSIAESPLSGDINMLVYTQTSGKIQKQ